MTTKKSTKKKTTTVKATTTVSVEVDENYFKELCRLQFEENEVLTFLGIDEKQADKFCIMKFGQKFKQAYAKFRYEGIVSLRASQFELAAKSSTMALHLGKKYLDDDEDEKQEDEDELELIKYTW